MVCLTIIHGADKFLSETRLTPLVGALPYKENKKTVLSEIDDASDDDEEYNDEEREDNQIEDVGALRISTRARIAYNLQSYNKNAMLVFNANVDFVQEIDRIPERISAIRETFTKFRFEIETYMDLRHTEVVQKCDEFFQRDFTEYGCVAIILLSLEGTGSVVANRMVTHWRADGNPTLRHKPKIFINEANLRRSYRELVRSTTRLRPPISEDHPDALYLRLPAIFHLNVPQPFQVFCDKLNDMADYDDLMTIIKTAIRETKALFLYKIYVASTLEKMMFLARSGTEVTRL